MRNIGSAARIGDHHIIDRARPVRSGPAFTPICSCQLAFVRYVDDDLLTRPRRSRVHTIGSDRWHRHHTTLARLSERSPCSWPH